MNTIKGVMRRSLAITSLPLAAFVVLGQNQSASGQQAVPLNIVTNSGTLPTDFVAQHGPIPPPPIFPPHLANTPTPSVNFQGSDDNNTSWPPDTDGCVGPNHVVTMLNTQVRIQDRSGNIISTTSLLSWWQAFFPSGVAEAFDPRILYDASSQRWIATAGANPQTTASAILIAVSTSNDPTGTWYGYGFYVDTSGNSWADFPTPGFNRDKLVVSWNYFPNVTGGSYGVGFFVLSKTNMYAGSSVTAQLIYQPYQSGTSTNGQNIRPAASYDTNDATIYLLQDFQDNTTNVSYLALYTITGAAGSAVLTRSTNFPSASAWAGTTPGSGNIAPQLGLSVNINTVDSRLSQVVHRNGSLWCAHTIFLPANNPTRSSVQFWQISTNGMVLQNGRMDDPNGVNFYAFPSIGVNRFGDALVGYSTFSTNQYASANYSFHAANEGARTLEADYRYKAGESAYWKTDGSPSYRNRWGDYSMSWVDPINDEDFWTVQEYAATYVAPLIDGSGRWGVWWANVRVAVPTNDFFTNAIVLSGTQGSTNGTNFRATKEAAEPNHAGNSGGASIWYQWTAPASGSVTFDTRGSSFNTLLAVYTGSSVGSLTSVASDNGSLGNGASRVVFTATSGTTYRIAVDGYNGATGNVILNWNQPSTPLFLTQPQSLTLYQGQNAAFTASAIGTPNPTYQWQFNGSAIGGATTSSYGITGIQTNNGGNYTVVASNSHGSVTSMVAVLTVAVSEATLSSVAFSNGQFQLTVSQVSSLRYALLANTNLSTTNWTRLTTNVAPFTFTDRSASNYPTRFYRALYLP
jgi:hypothetical protein